MSTAFTAAASRRSPLGLLFVIAMHFALVMILNQALGLRLLVPQPPPPLIGHIEKDPRPLPTDEVPPLDVRHPRTTTVERLAPPDLDLHFDDEGQGPVVTLPPEESGSADPSPRIPLQRGPSLDARFPLTQPAYPSGSIRLEETGVVELELFIGVDGRVRDARVLRSSGHPRLDRAAVAEAMRAWRLKPATLDGEPIEGRYRIKVTFRLDDR